MGKIKYRCAEEIIYYSPRYGKKITVKEGFPSDGASGPAMDIPSKSWWIHDVMCARGTWDDGTKCTNLQASFVVSDVLRQEGRLGRAITWFIFSFLFGGNKARKNGMFKLKK